eukprot:jgi/Chlat1/41/ChrspC235213S00001
MVDWDGIFLEGGPKELVYLEWKSWRCETLSTSLRNVAACTKLLVLLVEEVVHNASMLLTESIGNVKALQILVLRGCTCLKKVPEALGRLAMLQTLVLTNMGLRKLPESGDLTALQTLNLSACRRLAKLPKSISKLAALQTLDLSWNASLVALPESFGKLAALRKMYLCGCSSLTELPESFGELAQLQTLDLSWCRSLAALPESFGRLTALQKLYLEKCFHFTALPEAVSRLNPAVVAVLQQHQGEAAEEEELSKLALGAGRSEGGIRSAARAGWMQIQQSVEYPTSTPASVCIDTKDIGG